jgi:hypothetical protein
MPTYTYDDGSTISYDETPTGWSVSSTPSTEYGYYTDAREAAKLNSFVASAGANDTRPWYERVAEFGLSRAIDAHYGPSAVDKTTAKASYAGQDGKTYIVSAPATSGGINMNMLLLGALAVGAFLLLKD